MNSYDSQIRWLRAPATGLSGLSDDCSHPCRLRGACLRVTPVSIRRGSQSPPHRGSRPTCLPHVRREAHQLVPGRFRSTDWRTDLAVPATRGHPFQNTRSDSRNGSPHWRPTGVVGNWFDPPHARTHAQLRAAIGCRPRADSLIRPDANCVRRQRRARVHTPNTGPVPCLLTVAPIPEPYHRVRTRDAGALA